ncbi:MAG: Stk1 family PASTA domain-containing Ser/Thr kinase, partial [Propionibacteriaceae bacterium]|nr:Stk1 family PASTA domain-containing Ser/Thr kinase [Propionibacteriaceae bacterium]
RDTRLERDVAIKRLKVDLAGDPIFQERFRREAHAAAGLNHPNIVSVFDTGESLDEASGLMVPYIVMELVVGHTLREILHDGRKIQPAKALELTQYVLDALDYSHRHGIIHRDIKPANVMLTSGGQVKVMDFGIARAVSDTAASMTQTASVIGTPQYLSPEQIRGETVDRRSDVYAVGCLLYELLTGKPPFEGDSPVSLAYQHVRATPVPPSQVDPLVTTQMDAIVLKALAKNPADRFQTAHDMYEDIARLLAGQKVQAQIPPPVEDLVPTTVMGAADKTQVLPSATMAAQTTKLPARGLPPAPEEEEEPNHLGRTVAIIVSIVAVLALIAVIVVWAVNRGNTPPEPTPTNTTPAATLVKVPSVLGMKEDNAVARLDYDGLKAKVEYTQGADDTTVGTVTSQNPGPGDSVDPGSTVTLLVNQGPNKLTVPNVVGLSQTEAEAKLRAAGFTNITSTEATEEPTSAKAGEVTKTQPVADTAVTADTAITLTIATGESVLPNVGLKDETVAIQILTEAGFLNVTKVLNENDNATPGTVVEQTPAGGTKLPRDTPITLAIATPSPPDETTTPIQPPPTTPSGQPT